MAGGLAVSGWLITCLLFMALPGPDMALVTSWVLRRGPAAAWAAVLGINLSFFIYAALCVAGVAALIYRNPQAVDGLRVAGGAYLIYLAVTSAREASSLVAADSARSPLASGFISNLLNPKQIIFLVAVMPSFLPANPAAADLIYLLAALLAVSLVFWAAWIFGLSGIAARLDESRLRLFRLAVSLGLLVLGRCLSPRRFSPSSR